jgi:hypothetical protein
MLSETRSQAVVISIFGSGCWFLFPPRSVVFSVYSAAI